jgi:hypothetical protein
LTVQMCDLGHGPAPFINGFCERSAYGGLSRF